MPAVEDLKENFDSNQEALNLEIPVNNDLNLTGGNLAPQEPSQVDFE